MEAEQKRRYQITSFDLKDFSFLYYIRMNSRILMISVFNILLVLFNSFILCFAKNQLGSIEAVSLVGMIEMMFIHLCFYGTTNYCQYLDVDYMKQKSSYFIEHNYTRSLTDLAFYGFCVSMLFLAIASGYITFMLPENDVIRHEAIKYVLFIFPIIFLYAMITLSAKILSFVHKRHLSFILVILLVVLNMTLPSILFYCTSLGFDGIGLGTLLSFIVVTILGFVFVLHNFYVSETKVILDFKITLSRLKVAFMVSTIYMMSSFFKCSAMIALSLMGTNIFQAQQHLVMRVILYTLMILAFGIPRGISQSISYRLTKKHLAPADFIKYRKSIHHFYIIYLIFLVAYLALVVGMYPLYIDLMLMNNHDIVVGHGIDAAKAKYDLMGTAILIIIFNLSMSTNYIYMPFLNAMAKRSLNYWFALIGIFISCLFMYTLGIRNAGHFPYMTSIILPLAIFGVMTFFYVIYLYKRELKRVIEQLKAAPVDEGSVNSDIKINPTTLEVDDKQEKNIDPNITPIDLNQAIESGSDSK